MGAIILEAWQSSCLFLGLPCVPEYHKTSVFKATWLFVICHLRHLSTCSISGLRGTYTEIYREGLQMRAQGQVFHSSDMHAP